ncbi:undecaprenyl-diphosphatase [Keratinibaculum paraultunense]|uniref:Undecaprenyl-diphosphatase n=1 Tax=Keratinibaculum paraultunense TaxID=1278232 RepID=A0A4R3KYU1_9FIRM|nr:undecaprenyl-diphosphatase UppP [Keratinibaculum paraultunense]QQY80685.1 undecaprenyl-diphosphatase UppP [Keratinibaculum paraultunense]TCS89712.1 undecaprenyl-diphosphatase [Keratinibaculum paraultunense]
MTLFQAIILGIFQGISEFLPISSSGHLVVLQHFFNIKEGNLFFTEMLHFGTLISIVIVYFNDIMNIIVEFFKMLRDGIKNKKFKITNDYQKLALLIIIGSIPTAIIGLLFEDFFEKLYSSSLLPIGIAFLVTGFLLWIANKKPNEAKKVKEMTILDSLIVGTFQGIAIIPGISRSGSTIVAGLFRGFDRSLATEFSFLLALPATFGAGLLGIMDVIKTGSKTTIDMPLIIGILLSTIVGILAIKFLIKVLKRNKLHYFSYYLWIIGCITIFSHFIR